MRFSVPSSEAQTIRQHGHSERRNAIKIAYLHHELYRYSVVISKKQGTAPQRNYIKRYIRSIMQKNEKNYPRGSYLIFYTDHSKAFDRAECEKSIASIMKKITHKAENTK